MAKIVRGHQTKFKTTAAREALEHIEATLSLIAEQVKGLREPPAKLPRGTRDVTEQAAVALATAPEPEKTLRDRIRDELLRASLDPAELARSLKLPTEPIVEELRALAKEGLVANVGAEDFPMWSWRIGDDTPAKDLEVLVRRLITERPMTTRELTAATGARMTRVGGAIVAIQRSGANVLDLNPKTRAGRWFIVLPEARDARLKPKQAKEH